MAFPTPILGTFTPSSSFLASPPCLESRVAAGMELWKAALGSRKDPESQGAEGGRLGRELGMCISLHILAREEVMEP